MMWGVSRRIVVGLLQLLVVVFAIFVLIAASPGDPAARVAGDGATVEQIDQLRTQMGLDKPIVTQFGDWLGKAVKGDFGDSLISRQSIGTILARTLPPTVSMVVVSLVLTMTVGVIGGSLAALRPGGWIDRLVVVSASVAVALPSFFLGLVLVSWFAVRWNWFPAVGYRPLLDDPGEWLRHIILPSIALSTVTIAEVTRQLRGTLTDVLSSEYIVAARARGVPSRLLVVRHALKNAVMPVLTILGVRISQLIGGTVVIETVFNIQGMGRTLVNAALDADVNVVLGVTVVTAVVVLISNVVIDLIQPYFNPRLRSKG